MLATLTESNNATDRALRLAAWVVLGLCLVLAAWTGARAFWSLLALRHSAEVVALDTAAYGDSSATAAPSTDLATLHLFGQAGLPTAPITVEAPDTTLRLTLLGTAAADDPASGGAIVADESGAQGYYVVGDDLPGGAELREVHPDHVILSRQGRRESLRLDRDDTASATTSGPSTFRPREPGRAAGTAPALSAPAAPDWNAIRQNARVDPQKLMQLGSQIRALPFTENGKPIGVRLVASRDATLIRRLGLRSSDVIMSVNGIPLTDASRQFELMRLLESSSQFQVRIRRDGSPMTLTVDASALTSN